MPQTLQDLLANDYVTQTALKKIDHGLKKPRPGGHTIVRELQKDLLDEQDSIHGGNRKDKAKKWATPNKVLGTSDLYAEMLSASGIVAAVRDEIVDETTDILEVGGQPHMEHFFSSKVTFHINVASLLETMGETDSRVWNHTASFLADSAPDFSRYIHKHGAEDLLDRWLPVERHEESYSLLWDVVSASYRPDNFVDLVVSIRERRLVPGVNLA